MKFIIVSSLLFIGPTAAKDIKQIRHRQTVEVSHNSITMNDISVMSVIVIYPVLLLTFVSCCLLVYSPSSSLLETLFRNASRTSAAKNLKTRIRPLSASKIVMLHILIPPVA
jgi:hypothetical protein